jgi:enterochelin esterase-like enzyme
MVVGLVLALMLQGHALFSEFIKILERAPERDRAPLVADYLLGRATPLIENDSLLTFVWFGQADSAFVNGSLQGSWRSPERMAFISCGDTARSPRLFHRTYVVPPDSRLEYKLVVNGEYLLDPTNRRTTPPGDFVNSEAAMPKYRMSPVSEFRPEAPHGTFDSLQFTSQDTTIRTRRVWVYLPPGYSRLKNLPVVYVHDGLSAMRYMFFANIIDNLLAGGKLPPIICVFVPPVERELEYAGPKTPEFIDAFCDELVPLIDRTYHTSPKPDSRGVMGISNGGHIALIMGFVRPDCFRLVAGQSSTITPMLRTAFATRLHASPLPRVMKIWIDCGSFDIVDGRYNFPVLNRAFSAELARHGIPHKFLEVHDGHDWSNWRERTPEILLYFFR